MIKRITDKQGFFIRDDFTFDEETEIALDVEPAQGLYKPKWNGTEWVEGMTQAEINAIPQATTEPTLEDRVATVEEVLEVLYG